jgi:hypothetical protein
VVKNLEGLSDPAYYRMRGFTLDHREGVPVRAMVRVRHEQICPQCQAPQGCGVFTSPERPRTCHDFPARPDQVSGIPCSYWFERERDGVVERVGGLHSPYPTEA